MIATPQDTSGFWIMRPEYDSARTQALARLNFVYGPALLEQRLCRLTKDAGRWRLIACDPGAIT